MLAGALTRAWASEAVAAKPRTPGDDEGRFGVGAVVGAPTGLSLKAFVAPRHALQAAIAYGPLQDDAGRVHLDYLVHPAAIVSGQLADIVPYLGVGVGFAFWVVPPHGPHLTDHVHTALFARLPAFGFALHMHEFPADFFIEGAWTPLKNFNGDRDFQLNHGDVAVGMRWYF